MEIKTNTVNTEGNYPFKKPAFKGYRVNVGIKPNSGRLEYVRGNRKDARAMARVMKPECRMLFGSLKLIATIEEAMIKECDTITCKRLTDENSRYCTHCEALMEDARDIALEQKARSNLYE